jgi:multidrug transporter EmrE-like cation transporter
MSATSSRPGLQALAAPSVVLTLLLFGANLVFNVIANSSFKASAGSSSWRGFLLWQVIGNLAGFVTVLTLTAILRSVPLRVAFPVTVGLAVIGVQVVGARLLFHEPVSTSQWVGTLLIVAGIMLIGGR